VFAYYKNEKKKHNLPIIGLNRIKENIENPNFATITKEIFQQNEIPRGSSSPSPFLRFHLKTTLKKC